MRSERERRARHSSGYGAHHRAPLRVNSRRDEGASRRAGRVVAARLPQGEIELKAGDRISNTLGSRVKELRRLWREPFSPRERVDLLP